MDRSAAPWRAIAGLIGVVALVVALALPVLAADPSASPSAVASPSVAASPVASPSEPSAPGASASPAASGEPEAEDDDDADKEQRAVKPPKEHEPEASVTVEGTIASTTDGDGEQTYTLTGGATVLTLEAGPSWYWGDHHPLAPFVGKHVTVVGEQATGSSEIEVRSIDGAVVREPGKPPWAGGWKAVGKIHPGWTQEKADKFAAKQEAKAKAKGVDCWPPGHCKDVQPTSGAAGGH